METPVDGLEKISLANSDVVIPGSQTPPLKRKGKLSSLGNIFKPWKWRKKKTSEKFQETSAVLERKISTRQSREELIRRGVLKEIPDQETSNGHTVPLSIEPVAEVDIEIQDDSSEGKKTSPTHETEDKKEKPVQRAHPIHARRPPVKKSQLPPKAPSGASATSYKKEEPLVKKLPKPSSKQPHTPPSKQTSQITNRVNAKSSQPRKADSSKPVSQPSSSSPSTSSTSTARPKGSKNSSVGKKGNSGTPKVQKKPAKQPEHHKVPTTSSPKITPGPTSSRCPPEVTEAGDSVCKEPAESELPPSSLPSEQLAPEQPSPPELPANAPLDITAEEPPNGQAAVEENASVPSPSVSISDSSDQLQVEQVQDNGEEANGPQAEDKNISGENESCSSSDEVEESPGPAHQVLIRTSPEVTLIPNDESKEHQVSDSDSDGPVLYRDEEEDEDDEYTSSSLANKIHRKDTLTIKLGNRPSKKELEDKNILPRTSEEVKQEIRQQLVRRLSQRPTPEELEQRNILKQKNKEEEQEAKQELKRSLSRKLSLRPTVAELVARRILRFNEYVEVTDAKDYDRRADKPWTRLTPADKAAIRKELNEFKSTEMEVHEDSKQFTRFHRP
ncbi:phosphatase and actin regulator 2-like isoform X2 [Acipenser ruthenus]|uniref:phosphatase and actin regulator 2-like isoform X2 n=1 Tax=Acipenser ruthenus TaxID=7906 RepID=UPI002740546C|nr:phosphatase and actin regulator 2-like isoform X2 [Acipenser ruthenus]